MCIRDRFGTRVLPLDSVARNTLRLFSGGTTLAAPSSTDFPDGLHMAAIQWFLELSVRPEVADRFPVFYVDHDELLGLLGQKAHPDPFFSFRDLQPHLDDIAKAAQLVDDKKEDVYKRQSFRLTGPTPVVTAQRPAFRAFLDSVQWPN